MADELGDQSVFDISPPWWTLVYEKAGMPFPFSVAPRKHPDYGQMALVFTDVDLARTFIEKTPFPGTVSFELSTWDSLRVVLEMAKGNGDQYVGIDWSFVPDVRGRVYRIAYLLDMLRRKRS